MRKNSIALRVLTRSVAKLPSQLIHDRYFEMEKYVLIIIFHQK